MKYKIYKNNFNGPVVVGKRKTVMNGGVYYCPHIPNLKKGKL